MFVFAALFSKHKLKGLVHHFGWVPVKPRPSEKTLWLHTLSMGELIAATPILKQIRKNNPDLFIALSVTTDSGYETALKLKLFDSLFFHPLDCLPFNELALSRIKPNVYVFTDTGFWPGIIDLLYKKNIPIMLCNGRISQRSARRYLYSGTLFKETFQKIHKLYMQNSTSEKSALMLGVHKENIEVVNDPKFDALNPASTKDTEKLRKTLNLNPNTPLWIAGSTHAGEEDIILEAHKSLMAKHPSLILILAPRRMERLGRVISLLKKKNIPFTCLSNFKKLEPISVILLDKMGELRQIYSIGQIAFIGNSMKKPGGGHSLIEPLVNGLAVLHGPFVENIFDVSQMARKQGIVFQVTNSDELEQQVDTLLKNKVLQIQISEKAKNFIAQQQGSSKVIAGLIENQLKD